MSKISTYIHAFECAGRTDTGRLRDSNQDRIIIRPDIGLFAVVDGMGGLSDGEFAADAIASTMPSFLEKFILENKRYVDDIRQTPHDAETFLTDTICQISNLLSKKNLEFGDIRFGATISCIWLIGDNAIFVNLGDSRAYILQSGHRNIEQITIDHNMAAALAGRNELDPKDGLLCDMMARKLTRYMGMPIPANPDVFIKSLNANDTVFICSDGVTSMLSDNAILELLSASLDMDSICLEIVSAANKNGGRDNISAICLRIQEDADLGNRDESARSC